MDPQSIKDDNGNEIPYGPYRYKEIVKELYYISKNIHTSYNDLQKITPLERKYLIELLIDDINKEKELIEKRKSKQ